MIPIRRHEHLSPQSTCYSPPPSLRVMSLYLVFKKKKNSATTKRLEWFDATNIFTRSYTSILRRFEDTQHLLDNYSANSVCAVRPQHTIPLDLLDLITIPYCVRSSQPIFITWDFKQGNTFIIYTEDWSARVSRSRVSCQATVSTWVQITSWGESALELAQHARMIRSSSRALYPYVSSI